MGLRASGGGGGREFSGQDYTRENKGTFFERLEGQVLPSELLKIKEAYMIAKHAHRAQLRKESKAGGRVRYFEHVRRVALIRMDSEDPGVPIWGWKDVCAALLHDTIEDTEEVTAEILEDLFGAEVTQMVMSLTKWPGKKEHYLFQVYKGGERVIYLKMCDRLDNLRSLDTRDVSIEFREKQIKETCSVWIPGPFSHFAETPVYEEIVEICGYDGGEDER